ncbi:MAG: ABC transporter permease [Solirubrobacterales bacterium]|nr:ABC transporter permease [Solirubrobacterales bacterium]
MHGLVISSLWSQALSFVVHNGHIAGRSNLESLLGLTLETLEVSALGIVISCLIALPIGIWLGHIHRGSFLAINVGNIWRALPSLAVLAIGMSFLGIGLATLELALVVLAVPPMLTNAYVAIDEVDRDVVDAAKGMGFTSWQVIRQTELPLAIPLIFAGIRTSALFVVSTATIASLIGFNGTLGDIVNGDGSYPQFGILGAAICIAILALLVEGVLALAQRQLTPRGVRESELRLAPMEEAPVGT